MFVKWECGCVGIRPEDETQARILKACDEDREASRESLSWFRRDQTGRNWQELPDDKIAELHDQIARRFAMADRFEDARRALGIE